MSMPLGEHDELWKAAYKEVPVIGENLRYQNLLTVLKELYGTGFLTTEEYNKDLISVAKKIGFEITNKK